MLKDCDLVSSVPCVLLAVYVHEFELNKNLFPER